EAMTALFEDQDLYVLAMNTLLHLLKDDNENGKLFRHKRCNFAVFGLLKSYAHVEAAAEVISNQVDEESVSDLLSALSGEKESYEYRMRLLEALQQMMNKSNGAAAIHIKNSWHKLSGFTAILSLFASFNCLWPNCNDETSQLAMNLIEKAFVVIISIVKDYPKNRANLWYSWNNIADAIIATRRMFQILFDLAMEQQRCDGHEQQYCIFVSKTGSTSPSKFQREASIWNSVTKTRHNPSQESESFFLKNPEAILIILKIAS
ncbi:hypothetical protein RFI_38738, partial [Reticulomyxa filosa]